METPGTCHPHGQDPVPRSRLKGAYFIRGLKPGSLLLHDLSQLIGVKRHAVEKLVHPPEMLPELVQSPKT